MKTILSKKQRRKVNEIVQKWASPESSSLSSSESTAPDTSGVEKMMSDAPGSPSWTVYTSIKDIILDKYVDAVHDNDLSKLIIDGNPPEEALILAKFNLISQFNDTIGSSHNKLYKRLLSDQEQLKVRMNRVNGLIRALRTIYRNEIIDELRADGYDYPFTEETFLQDLESVEIDLKNEEVNLQIAIGKMESFNKNSDGAPTSRETYIVGLQLGSKMDGIHYTIKTITAEEYAVLLKRLIEHNKPRK